MTRAAPDGPIDAEPIEYPLDRTTPFDPAPGLGELREHAPVHRLRFRDGHIGWVVTRHDLAEQVLQDPRFSVRSPLGRMPTGDARTHIDNFTELDRIGFGPGNILAIDLPDHTRLRRALANFFTVKRAQALSSEIERIVAQRLDELDAAGSPVDLQAVFARPVAISTHCVLLGIPENDGRGWTDATAGDGLDPLAGYIRATIAERRHDPGAGLIGYLAARDDLSDAEIFALVLFVILVGHGTTTSMLTLGTFVLLENPADWRAVGSDPRAVRPIVEELLRYLTIPQGGALPRTATEDIRVGDELIRAGESVVVSLAAANRDPRVFVGPDEFRPSREEATQLAFGRGIHMCLGQHVARQEIGIGLARLAQRFPTLRLAIPADDVPLYSGDHQDYGTDALPVAWD